MADALPLAFTAALNPTLLSATMVMLFASEPKRLMSGFLLGAYTISISLGLVIVFALEGSTVVSTTQRTFSPAADVVVALLLIVVAYIVRRGPTERTRSRGIQRTGRFRRADAGEPKQPRWRRTLDEGSPRTAFAVGIVLTLPGASYLAGMTRISKANAPVPETVAAVVAFCLIMLLLIELPLLGYAVAPDATRRRVHRFTGWVTSNVRTIVSNAALVAAALLVLRALITVLS